MPAERRDPAAGDLPIYALDGDGDPRLFYAPGYLALVARREAGRFAQTVASRNATGVAAELRAHAGAALAAYRQRLERPFAPTCLTLYLHDGCNLRCGYCVSAPAARPRRRLDLATMRSAASIVAPNCRARGLPFTVVCHGGGEPTLEPRFLLGALDEVERVAEAHGVPIWRYLATNGVMSPASARRIARRFDLIGLSCDGPEDIQKAQRPLRRGGSSTRHVEATADVVHETGTRLHVRTTVLPRNAVRLPEIAAYLCTRLRPEEIAAEPVYVGGLTSGADGPRPEDAEPIVDAFLAAEEVAAAHGVRWRTSGSRLDEIHGPYCHVYRDVLNIVPGGVATACFKTPDARSARRAGLDVGASDASGLRLAVDARKVVALRERLGRWPGCGTCFNRFHCTRSCPDRCPALGPTRRDEFRCRFQRLLALRRLRALAAATWPGDDTIEMGVAL